MSVPQTISSLPRRLMEEGLKASLHRAWVLSRAHLMHRTGRWEALEGRAHGFWTDDAADAWLGITRSGRMLIGKTHLRDFRDWVKANPLWERDTRACAEKIVQGVIPVFGQDHRLGWPGLPWCTDWRHGFTWEPKFFREYRFYGQGKPAPYDVKFPWELSRFTFLLPLAQAAALTGDARWQEEIARVVEDWGAGNRLASSVSWCPMECAMRGVALALAAQMLAPLEATAARHVKPLLLQIALQGEFLSRNIEYARTRNNHYAAGIMAMLVMGHTLRGVYPGAQGWLSYGAERMGREIELQYSSDGVNFEKSTSYHRLVTELFLLGLLVMEKSGHEVPGKARERIRNACEYTRHYTRPDGLAPNFGDNDSACLLAFDPWSLRDHQTLSILSSALFSDPSLKGSSHRSSSRSWLLGKGNDTVREAVPPAGSRFFEAGGVLVSRHKGNFLMADFGEVGLRGRGGHGHNDTFSFELCLEGCPVVIDPGSPVYTGDLEMYDSYRGTAFHNTAMVDGLEMARLKGTWRISPEASPMNVRVSLGDEADEIRGEHAGYARLDDPVIHERTLRFFRRTGVLECRDRFLCRESHSVRRSLHLAPGLHARLEGRACRMSLPGGEGVEVVFEPSAAARLEAVQVSGHYGHLEESQRLVLHDGIRGETELSFRIVLKESPGGLMEAAGQ